jgi:gluconolactonase
VRWNDHGEVDEVLASTFEGKPFNAPNDLVIARSGWIYFTDPDFDLRSHHPEAVYALSPQGELQRFETGISRPNGIVLTPDESSLIINGTRQNQLIAWNLTIAGTPVNRRVFATVRDPNRAAYTGYPSRDWFGCDGMAMDHDANLYVTCGAGVEVFSRRGDSLGVIVPPQKPTNVCFGGEDRQTLFITAQTSVYAIACRIPGVVFQQA